SLVKRGASDLPHAAGRVSEGVQVVLVDARPTHRLEKLVALVDLTGHIILAGTRVATSREDQREDRGGTKNGLALFNSCEGDTLRRHTSSPLTDFIRLLLAIQTCHSIVKPEHVGGDLTRFLVTHHR